MTLEEAQQKLRVTIDENRMKVVRIEQEIRNLANDRNVMIRLIKAMPEIAAELPDIAEMKVVKTDDNMLDSLTTIVSQIVAVLQTLKSAAGSAEE